MKTNKRAALKLELDVEGRGQVFTPAPIVEQMFALRQNSGRLLEPACGDGAFLRNLVLHYPEVVAIELDPRHCPCGAMNMDFFTYPVQEKFATIIGNPPYVRARSIPAETKQHFCSQLLDGRANLYLHFIEKCLHHLAPGGELIFITPRDFLKATAARQLNTWLYHHGSITHYTDLGDSLIFADATPNCAIWRYQLGDLNHVLDDGRRMILSNGQICFVSENFSLPLRQIFAVKVGAVSGADKIYSNVELGNADFVCSHTAQSGELRRMIYELELPWLQQFKPQLLARRVTHFDENNWWRWGRRHHVSAAERIYVNCKTRNPQPFFLHPCKNYDGSVLALFPLAANINSTALITLCAALNQVDWQQLGFVCDGRYIFSQRSLENALLPEEFAQWLSQADNLNLN